MIYESFSSRLIATLVSPILAVGVAMPLRKTEGSTSDRFEREYIVLDDELEVVLAVERKEQASG